MEFLAQLLNGLQLGSIYALVALGYTMVYGIAKLINFAHGDIIMVGSYTAFFSIHLWLKPSGLPYWLAIIPTVLVCTFLGMLIERFAYRPLRHSPKIANLITAIGVSLFLEHLFVKLFSANARPIPPILPLGSIKIGSLSIMYTTLITLVITGLLTFLLQVFIKKTKRGKSMLAVSEDYAAATLVGISVDHTLSITFAIGSALAGVASLLYISSYPQIQPFMGSMLGIKVFTAAVLGGIGSIPGAVVGGLILGMIEAITRAFISSKMADAIVFGVLIIVLLIKPSGILGDEEKEKV